MASKEKTNDGEIEHTQLGDFHYNRKGDLTAFIPRSRLDWLIEAVGIAKVFEIIGYMEIDEFGDYKVVNMDLDNKRRYYLRMVNPSTNEIHYEGIPEDCRTVEAALKWRNKSNKLPRRLT
jgi:hypothetical protein